MNEAIAQVLRDGGGILPTSGNYTAEVWGRWLGRTEVYVTNHFRKLAVPYRRLGDQCYFDAADVWAKLALTTFEEDPARKRGGNRRTPK